MTDLINTIFALFLIIAYFSHLTISFFPPSPNTPTIETLFSSLRRLRPSPGTHSILFPLPISPMSDTIEVNFCERGTDHSFVLTIPAHATQSQLWVQLEKHVLIAPKDLVLTDENDIKLPPLTSSDAKLPPQFIDGALFTYHNSCFDETTDAEKKLADYLKTSNFSALLRIATTRPPLFIYLISKLPKDHIVQILDAPLTDLYYNIKLPPKSANGATSLYTLPKFVAQFARITLPFEHRKAYWKHQIEQNPDDALAKHEYRYIEGREIMQKAFEFAMEHTPEVFGGVHMLYVPLELNGKEIAAFVDSGAQVTLCSYDFAKRNGIDHLIDERFAGKAKGVGSGNLMGTIHSMKVKLGGEFLSVSLQVLDSLGNDFLLGLDNLKRHQMSINLKKNCLEFAGNEIPFLSEHQINEYDRARMKDKVEKAAALLDEGESVEDHMLDDEERRLAKQLLDEKQFSGQKSGQMNGRLSTNPSFAEMMTFINNNMLDIKKVNDYVTEQHEYNIVQHQRAGNNNNPDTRLIELFSRPLTADFDMLPLSLQFGNRPAAATPAGPAGGLGPLGNLPPEELLALLEKLKESIDNGEDPRELLASLPQEQAIALLQFIQQIGQREGMGDVFSGDSAGEASTGGVTATVKADEAKVKQLVEIGYPEQISRQLLEMYNNDIELVIAHFQDDDDMRD